MSPRAVKLLGVALMLASFVLFGVSFSEGGVGVVAAIVVFLGGLVTVAVHLQGARVRAIATQLGEHGLEVLEHRRTQISFSDSAGRGRVVNPADPRQFFIELEASVPDLSLKRKGVLQAGLGAPPESVEAGYAIQSIDPVGARLAVASVPVPELARFHFLEVRTHRMKVWGAVGSPAELVGCATQVRDAMVRGPWSQLGLRGSDRDLRGEIEGFPIRVRAQLRDSEVHTVLDVEVPSALIAGLEVEDATPSGNVVVDQLIQVRGELGRLEDDAFVEALLALVHGERGRLAPEGIVVERRGVLTDELPALLESALRLAAQLQPSS